MNNMENEVKKEQSETNKATESQPEQAETNEAAENQPEQVVTKEKKSGWGFKIGIGVIAAALVIGGVSFFAMGGMDRIRLNRNLSLANRYLEELDYEQAIAYFEEAIRIDPKSEEAYLGLADIYIEQGEYEKAIEILEEGLVQIDSEAIRSKLEEVEVLLADRYIEQEEYEKAVEILEEGLAQIDSEAISNKLEEVEELLAERENTAEELLIMGGETPVEGEVPAEGEAAAAGRVPYADEMAAIADASVGDIVYWGSYEQDNNLENGTEPVEWYVLDKADGEATLLAVYLLDRQPYYVTNAAITEENEDITEENGAITEENEDITWENCTLRSWLNNEFYHTAFSEEEQAAIVNANVVNEDNPYYGTEGGNDTVDKVWLLSLGEMERYFHIDMNVWDYYASDSFPNFHGREGGPTEYAIYCYGQDNRVCAMPTTYVDEKGGWTSYSEENAQYDLDHYDGLDHYGYDMSYAIGSGRWWLRSPGQLGFFSNYNRSAASVSFGGSVYYYGNDVINEFGVRPAINVAY